MARRVNFTSVIIPVGINHVIRGWPWVTIGIIAMCTVVQIYSDAWAPSPEAVQEMIEHRIRDLPAGADAAQEAAVTQDAERIANRIPSVRFGYRSGSGVSYRLVTSAFVHAGWLHLIGNMLFLWLVGAALEDRWGRARFAAFYASGAIASALCFSALHLGQEVTLVGASGAISALMGAFLVCFARMQIHFVYWLGRGIGRFDAAAYVALPLWLAEQALYAWLESDSGESGIAFTAHIGGFVFGLATLGALTLVARAREPTEATESRPSAPQPSARVPDKLVEPPKRPVEPPRPESPADPAGGPRFLT
jgi:membrane associated rhomboid family serine protease